MDFMNDLDLTPLGDAPGLVERAKDNGSDSIIIVENEHSADASKNASNTSVIYISDDSMDGEKATESRQQMEENESDPPATEVHGNSSPPKDMNISSLSFFDTLDYGKETDRGAEDQVDKPGANGDKEKDDVPSGISTDQAENDQSSSELNQTDNDCFLQDLLVDYPDTSGSESLLDMTSMFSSGQFDESVTKASEIENHNSTNDTQDITEEVMEVPEEDTSDSTIVVADDSLVADGEDCIESSACCHGVTVPYAYEPDAATFAFTMVIYMVVYSIIGICIYVEDILSVDIENAVENLLDGCPGEKNDAEDTEDVSVICIDDESMCVDEEHREPNQVEDMEIEAPQASSIVQVSLTKDGSSEQCTSAESEMADSDTMIQVGSSTSNVLGGDELQRTELTEVETVHRLNGKTGLMENNAGDTNLNPVLLQVPTEEANVISHSLGDSASLPSKDEDVNEETMSQTFSDDQETKECEKVAENECHSLWSDIVEKVVEASNIDGILQDFSELSQCNQSMESFERKHQPNIMKESSVADILCNSQSSVTVADVSNDLETPIVAAKKYHDVSDCNDVILCENNEKLTNLESDVARKPVDDGSVHNTGSTEVIVACSKKQTQIDPRGQCDEPQSSAVLADTDGNDQAAGLQYEYVAGEKALSCGANHKNENASNNDECTSSKMGDSVVVSEESNTQTDSEICFSLKLHTADIMEHASFDCEADLPNSSAGDEIKYVAERTESSAGISSLQAVLHDDLVADCQGDTLHKCVADENSGDIGREADVHVEAGVGHQIGLSSELIASETIDDDALDDRVFDAGQCVQESSMQSEQMELERDTEFVEVMEGDAKHGECPSDDTSIDSGNASDGHDQCDMVDRCVKANGNEGEMLNGKRKSIRCVSSNEVRKRLAKSCDWSQRAWKNLELLASRNQTNYCHSLTLESGTVLENFKVSVLDRRCLVMEDSCKKYKLLSDRFATVNSESSDESDFLSSEESDGEERRRDSIGKLLGTESLWQDDLNNEERNDECSTSPGFMQVNDPVQDCLDTEQNPDFTPDGDDVAVCSTESEFIKPRNSTVAVTPKRKTSNGKNTSRNSPIITVTGLKMKIRLSSANESTENEVFDDRTDRKREKKRKKRKKTSSRSNSEMQTPERPEKKRKKKKHKPDPKHEKPVYKQETKSQEVMGELKTSKETKEMKLSSAENVRKHQKDDIPSVISPSKKAKLNLQRVAEVSPQKTKQVKKTFKQLKGIESRKPTDILGSILNSADHLFGGMNTNCQKEEEPASKQPASERSSSIPPPLVVTAHLGYNIQRPIVPPNPWPTPGAMPLVRPLLSLPFPLPYLLSAGMSIPPLPPPPPPPPPATTSAVEFTSNHGDGLHQTEDIHVAVPMEIDDSANSSLHIEEGGGDTMQDESILSNSNDDDSKHLADMINKIQSMADEGLDVSETDKQALQRVLSLVNKRLSVVESEFESQKQPKANEEAAMQVSKLDRSDKSRKHEENAQATPRESDTKDISQKLTEVLVEKSTLTKASRGIDLNEKGKDKKKTSKRDSKKSNVNMLKTSGPKPKTDKAFHGRTLLWGQGVPARVIPMDPLNLTKPFNSTGEPQPVPEDPRLTSQRRKQKEWKEMAVLERIEVLERNSKLKVLKYGLTKECSKSRESPDSSSNISGKEGLRTQKSSKAGMLVENSVAFSKVVSQFIPSGEDSNRSKKDIGSTKEKMTAKLKDGAVLSQGKENKSSDSCISINKGNQGKPLKGAHKKFEDVECSDSSDGVMKESALPNFLTSMLTESPVVRSSAERAHSSDHGKKPKDNKMDRKDSKKLKSASASHSSVSRVSSPVASESGGSKLSHEDYLSQYTENSLDERLKRDTDAVEGLLKNAKKPKLLQKLAVFQKNQEEQKDRLCVGDQGPSDIVVTRVVKELPKQYDRHSRESSRSKRSHSTSHDKMRHDRSRRHERLSESAWDDGADYYRYDDPTLVVDDSNSSWQDKVTVGDERQRKQPRPRAPRASVWNRLGDMVDQAETASGVQSSSSSRDSFEFVVNKDRRPYRRAERSESNDSYKRRDDADENMDYASYNKYSSRTNECDFGYAEDAVDYSCQYRRKRRN